MVLTPILVDLGLNLLQEKLLAPGFEQMREVDQQHRLLCNAGQDSSGGDRQEAAVRHNSQIRPMDATVRYEVEIRRFASLVDSGAAIAVGDGRVLVDGEQIYSIKGARVGVFRDIAYVDYPRQGRHSRGGVMERG